MNKFLLVTSALFVATTCNADTVIIRTETNPVYELAKEYQDQARELRIHEIEQRQEYNAALFEELYGVPMPQTPYQEPPVIDLYEPQTEIIITEDP